MDFMRRNHIILITAYSAYIVKRKSSRVRLFEPFLGATTAAHQSTTHQPPATKSMDQLRGHLQSVLHQREQEREMLEQNDRVIEQGITNIQSVRRFLSDSVQELRRTGDPTILSKYEEILRLIYQEEDKALAFSRQHVREAERKNATIQQLRQTLDNLAVITSDHTRWVQISYISFHELSYPSL